MTFSLDVKKAHHGAFARLILAHGAGAGKTSDFMQAMAMGVALNGVEVVLFDFPYMQLMMATGKRRPPDRMAKLETHFKEVINHTKQAFTDLPTFIGGKSMGGRVATLIADPVKVMGGVVFGYPFHPPGKPEKLRTEHLTSLQTPFLILQGERDPFGTAEEMKQYSLSQSIQKEYLTDGEHSFKTRKSSGLTQQDNMQTAINKTIKFLKERCSK